MTLCRATGRGDKRDEVRQLMERAEELMELEVKYWRILGELASRDPQDPRIPCILRVLRALRRARRGLIWMIQHRLVGGRARLSGRR